MSFAKSCLAGTALLSLVVAVPALADTKPQEVVVTARKKPEPLSRTPLSVAVVTGDALQSIYGHDLKDLQDLTPSLFVISTANEAQTTARLRGVGTVGDNPGLESSVGVVIDGVQRPRTATAMSDLGPVDHIEILKGPQSDVYGKGASAGVIQVLTERPDFKPRADAELTGGDQGLYGASAYVTGAVGKQWAGSVYLATRHRDGQYRVHTGSGPRTETRDNGQNYSSARGQLLFVPNDRYALRLIADYTRRDEFCCTGTAIVVGATRAYVDALASDDGTAVVADPKARNAWSNRSTAQRLIDTGVSAQVDYRLTETVQLTSVTALRHWDHRNGYDADFTSADIYYRDPNGDFGNRFDTMSEELRLNGKGAKLDWMLGVFLDQENLTRHDETLYGKDYEAYVSLLLSAGANPSRVSQITGLPVGQSYVQGLGSHDLYEQNERNFAVFGHAQWQLADGWSLQVGARLNRQNKHLTSRFSNSDNGVACARATASQGVLCLPWSNPAFNAVTLYQLDAEDAATGSVRLKWQATPTVMAYASWSRGWKGAGFNLDREQKADYSVDPDTAFKAETSQSWELGLKSRHLDGRLALDLAVFDEVFHNFQLNTFLGTTVVVDSIPRLRSKGIEAESRYDVGAFNLHAGLTYDDAEFGREAIPGLPLIAGGTASFAPKWSASYGFDYGHAIGNFRVTATLAGKYNSGYNTGSDLNPLKVQKAYALYDGQVALSDASQEWSLELWGRNLTDVAYYQVAFAAPFQSGSYDAFLGQPRTVGLTLRLHY